MPRLAAFGLVIALLVGGVVAVTSALIRSGVEEVSALALQEQPGNPVLSLIAYVESPAHSLRDRNRAAWALGRLGDERALPVLEKHLTGEECDHERALCQRELRKAIDLCRKGGER